MPNITISDEVMQYLARRIRGRENIDAVLRRLLGVNQRNNLRPRNKLPPQQEGKTQTRPNAGGGKTATLLSETFSAPNQIALYQKILERLAERNPQFLQRFSERTSPNGAKRYVARSRGDLYLHAPHLANDFSTTVQDQDGSKWYVATNLSRPEKEKAIETACDVAGLRYRTDLRLDW